jgi:hypothetical protein
VLAIGLFAAAVAALYITVKSCIQSFRAVKKALRIIQRHGCKAGLKFLVKAASESKVVKIGCVGPVLVLCVYNPFGCGLCTLIRIRLRNRRLRRKYGLLWLQIVRDKKNFHNPAVRVAAGVPHAEWSVVARQAPHAISHRLAP